VRVRQPDNSAFEVQSDDVESLFSSDVAEKIVKKCIVCTKSFLGKFAFSQHLREGHDASEGPFSCPSCAVNCADGTMLLEHLSAVHRDEEFMAAVPKSKRSKETFQCDTVPCSIADHVFTSFTAFKMHTISVHGIFPLRCDVCGNRYKERQTLRNHLETHGGEMRYPCDVCASSGISKKFVTRERLFAHRRLHLGRRFVCGECQECFLLLIMS
jgi:KRAB domain-containing zinc finger protein